MPHRILVPLDGSELAEHAVPWADELAAALQANVELLEVLPLTVDWAEQQTDRPGPATDDLQRARGLVTKAAHVEGISLHGSPAPVIVARAQASGATLVVLSSHGRSGLARAVMGSVAADVLRDSSVPVVIVPAETDAVPSAPRRVLVPLDISEYARTVLDWVGPLARELGWTLILCAVADLPPQPLVVQGAAIPLPTGHIHTPVEMATYLEGVAAGLQAQGFNTEIQVLLGEPGPAIAEKAVEWQAGLIAMSTHGRHGIERWALGSITEEVIQNARLPVLAFHPSED